MRKIAELLDHQILHSLSVGKLEQANKLKVLLNTVRAMIEEDDDQVEMPTFEEAFKAILLECTRLGLGAGNDEHGKFKLRNRPLELAQEKIQQCFASLRTYQSFHNMILYSGQPLQQNGVSINHTELNEAFRLLEIALNEEPKIFLKHEWPYGGCELDEATPCDPFNCCEICQVPGAGHHAKKD